MAHAHPLEGDGLQTQLFHYLWKQGQGIDDLKFEALRIPDTIVFFNVPIVWYYWSDISGEIRKKGGEDLERTTILRSLLRRRDPGACDVVASFLSHRNAEEDTITFMNADELAEFLMSSHHHQGILQRFVLPRSDFSEMVQAIWSPKMFIVNKRVNRIRLNDRYSDRNEKCITFEGPTHFTEDRLCAPAAKARIEEVCQAIVEHIKGVDHHHYTVSRMVLYFKEDRRNPNIVWLMFSSSFRFLELRSKTQAYVQAKPPLELTPNFQGLHVAALQREKSLERPATVANRYRSGYLRNIRLEDMDLIANAALTAGLADEEEEDHVPDLLPIAEIPQPTNLRSIATPDADLVVAPNDTIKAEMLLERIYYNQKTRRIYGKIQQWELENKKITLDRRDFQQQKKMLRAALEKVKQPAMRRSKAGSESPASSCRLPLISEKQSPTGTATGSLHSGLDATQSLTVDIPIQPATIANRDLQQSCTTTTTTATTSSSEPPGVVQSTVPSIEVGLTKQDSTMPQIVSGRLRWDKLRSRRSSVLTSLSGNSPPLGNSRLASEIYTGAMNAGALSIPVAVRRRKSSTGGHEPSKKLGSEEIGARGRRILNALGVLTGGEDDGQVQAKLANVLQRKSKRDMAEAYSPVELKAIMHVIEHSYMEANRKAKEMFLSLAEEMNDRIYNWYSEVALCGKLQRQYFFSMPSTLARVLDSQFSREKQTLNIITVEEFEEAERDRLSKLQREAPVQPKQVAPTLRSASSEVHPLRPLSAASDSKSALVLPSFPSRPGTADSVKSYRYVQNDEVEREMHYVVSMPDRARSKEFSRLLQRLQSYLVDASTAEERIAIEGIAAQLRMKGWFKTLRAIRLVGASHGQPGSASITSSPPISPRTRMPSDELPREASMQSSFSSASSTGGPRARGGS
eukprot:GGOE01002489.1.p1 GENE.GGOE01002489.1~~GGOE01002489.1.p1  ORF type:complete len:912 (+),score=269.90 GGOE01002489.1:111-2846(+)